MASLKAWIARSGNTTHHAVTTVNNNSTNTNDKNIPLVDKNTDIENESNYIKVHTQTQTLQDQIDQRNSDFKTQPPSLLITWWKEAAWPGMGLFGESYILFSIGLIKPFWKELYPECFEYYQVCSLQLISSLTYSVVLGVICGMIMLGYSANYIGRRLGGITTAFFMCFGSIGLTLISLFFADNPKLLFRFMSSLLFLFGIGVGGEYPISSSTATEKAMGEMKLKLKAELDREAARQLATRATLLVTSTTPSGADTPYTRHLDVSNPTQRVEDCSTEQGQSHAMRGRAVQLVFMSQGLGILVNSVCLVMLLLMFGQYGSNTEGGNYSSEALLSIWRIVYLIGALTLIMVFVTRLRLLKESTVWEHDKERREQLVRSGLDGAQTACSTPNDQDLSRIFPSLSDLSEPSSTSNISSTPSEHQHHVPAQNDVSATPTQLLVRYFGWRIFGSSATWFLWDVAFYGNKLFQSKFLLALTGEDTTSLLQLSGAAALNAFVALLGYIGAALLLDNPRVGRLRLQLYGLLCTGALFVGCGIMYDKLASSSWLIILYFASSFAGQLGPNATTFLIPSEIFPTPVRTQCHGIAAASGKCGALLAAVAFNHINNDADMFWISGYASLIACVITFWTIPDVTTLDLHEIDRQWSLTLQGRRSEYVGDATNPKFLSYYERRKLGMY